MSPKLSYVQGMHPEKAFIVTFCWKTFFLVFILKAYVECICIISTKPSFLKIGHLTHKTNSKMYIATVYIHICASLLCIKKLMFIID